MGVGPTLLGGVIGAAVGVALHLVLETGMLGKPIEASWFAIVIGLLTGLGVRQANRTHMERSYLRGAISAALALAAIFASTLLLAEYMKNRDAVAALRPTVNVNAATATGDASDDAAAEAGEGDAAAPAETTAETSPNPLLTGDAPKGGGPASLNPWQFVFMALGALVAYEFGRGGGPPKVIDALSDVPPEGLGRATDPNE